MSLPFERATLLIAMALCSGCAGAVLQSGTAQPPATPALLSDVVADARTLEQPDNAARLEAVQALLRQRGFTFTLQPVLNAARQRDPRAQGHNVIVDLPGPSGAAVVVGAHLDAVALNGGGLSRGMVDNGAGVVVLMRVAEALTTHRLRNRIRIVFFDLEETGLQGSRLFATTVEKGTVKSMVNIDIAGYGDTLMSGASGEATAPLRQALGRVCTARGLNCVRFPALPNSDDRSFQAAGIPAISLAVLPALEAHQVWLLLNGGKESGLAAGFAPPILRTIHTPEDSAEKLTPAGMTLMYNAVLGLLLELDAG